MSRKEKKLENNQSDGGKWGWSESGCHERAAQMSCLIPLGFSFGMTPLMVSWPW